MSMSEVQKCLGEAGPWRGGGVIIAEARRIETAEIAELPDEDSCRLFQPEPVATTSDPEHLARVDASAQRYPLSRLSGSESQ